jgi:large repetitive protein
VRELAPSAINAVRRAAEDGADLDTTRGLAETLSTRTVYNDEITDSEGRVVMPAGTVVTDVYAPARASITKDGSAVTAREHTRTTYDEGAPNGGINPATGQRYALPTKVTVGAALSGGGDEENDLEFISVTEMGYARSQSADGDGWVLGTATSRTVAGATAVNRYDGQGRLIEYRQPLSNGTDAGATSISYYTAGSNSANSACANKPEWAGLECQVGPKADAVATGASAGGGGSLPSTTTTYTKWLDVAETIETSASSTRTNTTAYDSAGREFKSTITASISGSTAVPGTFTKYQSSTGLIDYTGKLNAAGNDATEDRTVYTYDSWGREIRRINDLGDEISTAYDTSSRPIEVTDPRGTTTTTYNSGAERRGVPTSMSVSRASDAAGSLKFTADYDADGNMVTQELPGGITQTNLFDATGNQVGITYAGQLTSSSGEVTTGPWIGFSQDRDVSGRVRFDYTTEGAAAAEDADTASIGQSGTFNRAYSYDASGRLARVDDQSAAAGSEAASAPTACTRRDYTFDANGRRTSLKSGVSTDGTCASGTASISYAYDSADRPTTGRNGAGAYVYDAFGRQTTIPAVDAPNAANAEITLGYFDTDAVRSISQDGRQTSYTLDTDGRRSTQTVTSGSVTSKVTMHYSDDSDNPSWTQLVNGSTSSITRYEASLSGKLGVSISQTKSLVSLLNLHGDVAAIVPVGNNQASSSASTSLEDWSTYDEYGERIASSVPSNAQTRGYGWLGSKQRFTSDETMGLTLMGARLYNPSRGLFTSVDPLPGGTESAYAYPADPVNETDISGLAQDPGGTRIKCKCTKKNRNWSAFPIRTVLGKWGKWSNVPYTSRVPRFIKRLLDDWFDNVIGARVTKRQIRHKTNTVVFWRCRKGYKQYKTVRTTVGQYRWRVKFKVLFTSKSLWFSGSGSVTGRRTTYSS